MKTFEVSKINSADLWLALIIVLKYGLDKPVPGILWFFLAVELLCPLFLNWLARRRS